MKKVKNIIRENNWLWAAAGAFLLWLIMGLTSGRLNVERFSFQCVISPLFWSSCLLDRCW